MIKLELEDFIYEIKEEMECYAEIGKEGADKWEEKFRKWLDNPKIKHSNVTKKGDKVVTIGGMFGVITAISEKKVTLKLAEDVEVDFARSAISAFQDPVKQEMAEK